jgi:hypothetical protein
MKYLTTEQAKKIYQDAKGRGLDPDEVMAEIVRRGTTIEGIDMDQARQFSQQKQPQIEQPQQQLQPQENKPGFLQEGGAVQQFGTGLAKSGLSLVKGMGQLGEKILPPIGGQSVYSDEATKGGLLDAERLKGETGTERVGKFVGDVAQFAIPAGRIAKATQGASMAGRIIPRMISSGTVATLQEGEVGKGTAIAVGAETAMPVAGKYIVKPVAKFIGGLFRGTGSILSGVSDDVMKILHKNAKTGQDAVKTIKASGQEQILKDNIQTYIKGMTKLRSNASAKFGKALDTLSKTDVDDKIIKKEGLKALEKNGIIIKNGKINLSNSEILNPQLQKKLSTIINTANKTKLTDGKSLRETIKRIEAGQLKNPGLDPDRLAYNGVLDDLADGFRNSINLKTDVLSKANLDYSKAKGLAKATEDILGKVKFKNQSEILAVSKKMETILKDKGLTQEVLNDFFKAIGQDYSKIKTREAVRQISTKALEQNTVGTNPFEWARMITSKIVTPKMVRDIAIFTGKSEPFIKELLEKTAPSMRSAVIKELIPPKE